ncbi:MAG: SMEK domain-containing protein, partial [Prevotellaceae bacterium]|nr:SMEK domain-containing protein [Prevotellaceae bacterium]
MNESIKRIDFIAGYISAYEEKIKLLNASGLLSEAKLFELFAINVGGLYLGQGLSNLNIDTYAYPCVDLISDDGQIYIQVSTAKNIPTKVKETLEKIRDSSRSEIDSITSVKFIVLHNDSVDRVKDYTGENQIGKVPFIKANDLITTALIVQRVQDDLDFQIALYDLLSKEAKSIKCSSFKLKDAIENSKIIMSHSIDCKINKEYEIDRSEIISKINIDGHKNISIHGEAGSGKSVLCKKLVESEEKMLYARAEQFREATDINAIWGFNIKQTLEYLGESPIIFFIDSLEFIADVPTKWDLLLTFYEHTKMYPHAKIITTCRTSDKNAFIKIEGAYSVFSYVVEELTESELLLIANKYPIISNMNNTASYAKLLKSPFYLNLIISKITDFDNIADENELREYIWKYIICMDDLETKNVVESIVFTRAMKFSLGAITSNYDTKIIRKLISSNVLIENRNVIRLKYDIFEDICFEQYLDAKFDECRGKYDEFFSEIEGFGRCIYRRYQIWVENKLFAKSNREKFLNVLVFSKTMPQNWRKQTIIGLVKSRYCVQFFDDFGATISSAGIIGDFIKITNLYAFEVTPYSKEYLHVQLRPCGEGRQNLIHLVAQAELYKGDAVSQVDIEKLCSDYARAQTKEEQTAKTTSLILIYFLENHISESDSSKNYRLSKDIISMLKPIYQLANYSKEWIMSFWAELTTCYKGDNDNRHLAADIIEDTLKFEHVHLAKHLPAELCTLAEMFWTYSPVERYGHIDHGYDGDRDDITYLYGLSKKAKRYANNSNKGALYDSFFLILFKSNFWIGFDWAINFINNAVINFAKKQDEDLPLYEIYFIKDDFKKSYLGYPEMWLASTDEYRMPMIISDMIYCLKEVLYEFLKAEVLTNEEKNKFAKDVRKYIYEKSNNIALLTLIADIGMDFMIERPGFSLDLVTNIEIIQCDINRYFMRVKNPALKLLEQQIYKTVGIPSALMSGRYKTDNPSHLNLQVYVAYSQVYCDKNTKSMCYRVLDYLYSIITNDSDNAIAHLQIQKMDTRAAETIKIDDTISMLVPTVTGEAKKIVAEGEKKKQPENTITSIIYDCNEKLAKKGFTLSDCLETI